MLARFLVALALAAVMCSQVRAADCEAVRELSPESDAPPESRALHSTKVQYALAIISEEHYQTQTQDGVAKVLFFLGRWKVREAIPRATELLSFEHKVVHYIRTPTRNQQYPAIAGLAGIGKPAVPALLRAIASANREVLIVHNATFALMTIYRERPGAGIAALRKAASAAQDRQAAENFREALAKAESIWCKDPSRCGDQPK